MEAERGGGHENDPKMNAKQRICNSDDNAANDFTTCRKASLDSILTYDEIRIASGDWESSIFLSWIMQILMSEILDVPVTIETSQPRSVGSLSFYSETNDMVYPAVPYNYDALRRATDLNGDCNVADLDSGSEACAHILPEVWSGQINAYTEALAEGYIEPPEGNGMIGKFSFMIPRELAASDPSLASWQGLQDRKKVAETFLRPTTWLEYCDLVPESNCTAGDDTAVRSPESPEEEASYFMDDLYTGFFRPTEKNDCETHPDTCTGHVVDAPCEWDTSTESQVFWNNIPLTSDGPLEPNNGYGYFQMLEIWKAANATKSPIFMWWWKPDSLDQLFADTDYALQPVFLPPPTEECEKNRVTNLERCSADPTDRIGTALGSCDFPAHSLQKVLTSTLAETSFAAAEATRSPAYDFIKRFRVSDLSLTIILRHWISMGSDTYGVDPRIAVCQWVYNNLEQLEEKTIPAGYPREISENFSTAMYITSLIFGSLALALTICAAIFTLKYRKNAVFRHAYVPFVLWLLGGIFLVCCASILYAPEPTNFLCIAQPIFATLGYTIEILPLIVKSSAVYRLISDSKKMKKVKLNVSLMHAQVGIVVGIASVYLLVWNLVDPQRASNTAYLVEQGMEDAVISTTCQADSEVWIILTYGWQGLLLVAALVLAVQSRNVKQEFNESQSLAFMVYSHTLFLVVRSLVSALPADTFSAGNIQSGIQSLCLSLDSTNTLFVYFAPKFYAIVNKHDKVIESDRSRIFSTAPSRGESDRFDEPPPGDDELRALMGEACHLLIQAKNDDDSEHLGVSLSQDGTKSTIERANFFTRKDLMKLRTICSRISRAQFGWEEEIRGLERDPNVNLFATQFQKIGIDPVSWAEMQHSLSNRRSETPNQITISRFSAISGQDTILEDPEYSPEPGDS